MNSSGGTKLPANTIHRIEEKENLNRKIANYPPLDKAILARKQTNIGCWENKPYRRLGLGGRVLAGAGEREGRR
jgi:hypothetical protein